MRTASYLTTSSVALLVLAGCYGGPEGDSGTISASSVSEIPITTSSDEALAAFMEGRHQLDLGKFLEANALFRESVQVDPSFAYGYLSIANSSTSLEEFKTNVDLAAANAEEVSEGERLLIEIGLSGLGNDVEGRLQLAEQLVEEYPASQRAWLALAGVQGTLNRQEKARESLSEAIDLDPSLIAPYTALGFSYLFSEPRDFAKAEEYMRRAIDLEPQEPNPQVFLGDTYRAQQRLEQAREAYTRATELDETHAIAFIKKGHVGSFLGHYEEARADYQRSVYFAVDQQKATYANYEAFTYVHEGNPRSAIEALQRIVESVDEIGIPEHQRNGAKIFTLSNMATIALHQGYLDIAEGALDARSALLIDNANTVGTSEFRRGQEANIAYWAGQLAARGGDFGEAVRLADENATLLEQDNNPRKLEPYHDLLGLVNLLQGNYDTAIEHYKQANLNVMYIRYHLGLAYEGAGDVAQANKIFREVSEFNFNTVGFALVRRNSLKKTRVT